MTDPASTPDHRPCLEGRHVVLRVVRPQDYDALHQIEHGSGRTLGRWRQRGVTSSFESYVRDLWAGVLSQFLVVDRSTSKGVGLVTCYRADFRSQHAYLGVLSFDSAARTVAPMEGLGLFVLYLFDTYPFRKLYGEVAGFNFEQFASGEGVFFSVEGRLRGHTFLDGEWHDQIILAIHRDEFLVWRDHLVASTGTSAPSAEGSDYLLERARPVAATARGEHR